MATDYANEFQYNAYAYISFLVREIVALYHENGTEHMNTLCGKIGSYHCTSICEIYCSGIHIKF